MSSHLILAKLLVPFLIFFSQSPEWRERALRAEAELARYKEKAKAKYRRLRAETEKLRALVSDVRHLQLTAITSQVNSGQSIRIQSSHVKSNACHLRSVTLACQLPVCSMSHWGMQGQSIHTFLLTLLDSARYLQLAIRALG